jgi:hypothetical protein
MIMSLPESVSRTVALSSIDLRYEHHRLKSAAAEKQLLSSILSRGIEEPLQGVDTEDCHILLNGLNATVVHESYRCWRCLTRVWATMRS